ncbi:MAG: FAD-dependent oxidoreductase [Candidatus Omnitrophica bacterium]|nr:FAD-dependent oxidoreductase [Candidatus Omnitrophota bacterium]
MKVAVIGAGISGLLTAFHLCRHCEIIVFEEAERVGGLSAGFNYQGYFLEKYNHFFSAEDKHILNTLEELGLYDKLYWARPKQVFFSKGRQISLNSPWDLLKLDGLTLADKFRLASFMRSAALERRMDFLVNTDAAGWIKQKCPDKVYERYFRPLFEFKFGSSFADISALYLWARFKEKKNKKIGYLKGGVGVLHECLVRHIQENNGGIFLKEPINRLTYNPTSGWQLRSLKQAMDFDAVVCCVPFKKVEFLCADVRKFLDGSVPQIKYLNVSSTLLHLEKPLKKGYWFFIVDEKDSAPLVIIDTSALNGQPFVYVPEYTRGNSFSEKDENIRLDRIKSVLKNVNPDFNNNWIRKSFFFSDQDVEPVADNAFLSGLLNIDDFSQGIFIPELLSAKPYYLKTLNSCALKAKIIAKRILEKNAGSSTS